jgi:hypothetical protein
MIWLTWRQHRKQALFTVIALAALAAIVVPTGLAMRRDFTGSGVAACLAKMGTATMIPQSEAAAGCQALAHRFEQQYTSLTFVGILFVILPVFVGMFFGAPLIAREVEHGTHRLVWTQGVGRMRWALAKFGLLGAATAVLAVVYALGVSWWFEPIVTVGSGRLGYLSFDVQGIVPVAYTLFAVALGVFAGTYWNRVLPAMGVALVGFAAVRVAIEVVARPRFLSPETLTYGLESALQPNPASGDWVYALGVRNAQGQLVLPDSQIGCPPSGCGPDAPDVGPGAYNWQLYQPGDRFWIFQGIETGVFVALTALLVFFALRRLRRIA